MPEDQKKRRARLDNGRPIPHLASRIFNSPLMINEAKGDAILAALSNRLGIAKEFVRSAPVLSWDDDDDDDDLIDTDGDDYGYTVQNGIAKINVYGTLVKRATGMDSLSGLTSYQALQADLAHAMANDAVKGVLFDVDSPGGEAAGMSTLSDYIFSMRGVKPMCAVSNDDCYSAAYGIASAADMVCVTRDGGCGSIGCYMLHVDRSEADKQNGLKYTYIYAGDKKVDGNPHEPLKDSVLAELQTEVDRQRDMFVSLVARNRGVTAQQIYDLQAGCKFADMACPLLADKVCNLDDAMADMMAKLNLANDDEPTDPMEGVDAPDPTSIEKPMSSQLFLITEIVKIDGLAINGVTVPMVSFDVDLASKSNIQMLETADGVTIRYTAPDISAETFDKGQWPDSDLSPLCSKLSEAAAVDIPSGSRTFAMRGHANTLVIQSSVDDGIQSEKIQCRLAPYGEQSRDLGGFREVYQVGCFKRYLQAGDDVRAVFNHNPDFILGRRTANTAKFYEEFDGLYMQVDVPDTTWAKDLLVSMKRGDISGSSAAFYITKFRWETKNGEKTRVIEEARLVEGSVASFPIYETAQAVVQPAAEEVSSHEVTGIDGARLRRLRLLKLR